MAAYDDGRAGMTFKVSADRICCMADEGVELGHIEFHQLTPDTNLADRKSVV